MLLIATVVVCKTEMLKENCNPPTVSLRETWLWLSEHFCNLNQKPAVGM